MFDLDKKLTSATANLSCQTQKLNETEFLAKLLPNSEIQLNNQNNNNLNSFNQNSQSDLIDKENLINLNFSNANFKKYTPICDLSPQLTFHSDSRPISALYDIICKEKDLTNSMSGTESTTETNDMGLLDSIKNKITHSRESINKLLNVDANNRNDDENSTTTTTTTTDMMTPSNLVTNSTNSNCSSSSCNLDELKNGREDRMAKYKEERRKQLGLPYINKINEKELDKEKVKLPDSLVIGKR